MQENENRNNQYGVPQPAEQAPNGNNGMYTPPLVRNAVPKNNSSMAVASLVLGIFGLIGCWVPVWNIVLSIAGIVCGIICLAKDLKSKGMGIAGIVISTLGLLFSIVFYMLLIIAVA